MKKISKFSFDSEKFDCLVCLNSNLPNLSVFSNLGYLPVIAADGAAIQLINIGIVPEFVIGDFDSIPENFFETNQLKTKLIKIDDQETNDFEKILLWCKQNNLKKILITGIHGGDLEHSLNNISIFNKYSNDLLLVIFENNRYGIYINQSIEIDCKQNEVISIIPQPITILSSSGLKWELNETVLEYGKKEGARNRAISTKVKIINHSGSFLLFFDSKLPFCPNIF